MQQAARRRNGRTNRLENTRSAHRCFGEARRRTRTARQRANGHATGLQLNKRDAVSETECRTRRSATRPQIVARKAAAGSRTRHRAPGTVPAAAQFVQCNSALSHPAAGAGGAGGAPGYGTAKEPPRGHTRAVRRRKGKKKRNGKKRSEAGRQPSPPHALRVLFLRPAASASEGVLARKC